jgi:DNA-binding IclR family transcriptional regulator
VNQGEFREGVAGVAAPVRDRSGSVIASVGIWGSEQSILGPQREGLSRMAIAAARDISRDLGFITPERSPAVRPRKVEETAV